MAWRVCNKILYRKAPPRGPIPNPLIWLFSTEKLPLWYIFWWQMIPLSRTSLKRCICFATIIIIIIILCKCNNSIWIIIQTREFSSLFHIQKMRLVTFLVLLHTAMTDSPTHHILQLVKFLPFHITEAWNQRARYPFRTPRDEAGRTDCTMFAGFRVRVRELPLFKKDVHSHEFWLSVQFSTIENTRGRGIDRKYSLSK